MSRETKIERQARIADDNEAAAKVGDTVTVGEVTLACEPTGWTRVGMVSA